MSAPTSSDASRPVAVVTGGTRGIGLGIVRDLAPTHHVVVGGRTAESVERALDDLPSGEGFVADLADCGPGGSLDAALSHITPRLPRVDLLVHSAGVLHRGDIADVPMTDWSAALTVNVVAVAGITSAFLPALRSARGLVVAINSGAGLMSVPTMGPYCASKFAMRAFADALREEERVNGVRVTSVYPGRVDTDMQHEMNRFEGGAYDREAYLRVESVVKAVRLAVEASDEACVADVSVRPRGWRAPDA
jgi:NAD(P)-dependent dehydrogenase (short-subunit alcohol dehydrogenase family)